MPQFALRGTGRARGPAGGRARTGRCLRVPAGLAAQGAAAPRAAGRARAGWRGVPGAGGEYPAGRGPSGWPQGRSRRQLVRLAGLVGEEDASASRCDSGWPVPAGPGPVRRAGPGRLAGPSGRRRAAWPAVRGLARRRAGRGRRRWSSELLSAGRTGLSGARELLRALARALQSSFVTLLADPPYPADLPARHAPGAVGRAKITPSWLPDTPAAMPARAAARH